MKLRNLIILFVLGLMITLAVSSLESTPGYMDAEYYYLGGIRLGTGHGFTENILWNYLDDPKGLPHPSHLYWMPLTSIVAAIGPSITGQASFPIARIPFIGLAGLVPVLTAILAYQINGTKQASWVAGLLAIFPGFYLAYYPTTDTFLLYMLLGGMFILVVGQIYKHVELRNKWLWGSLGLIAGLMHLSRADGVLWFVLAICCLFYIFFRKRPVLNDQLISLVLPAGFLFLGYFLIMGPWIVRNLIVSGSLLSPGGLRAIWVTNYDELYSYPASQLTFQHWISIGIPGIIADRGQALLAELKTALGVQAEIFLLPLITLGVWKYRKDIRVQVALVAWILTLAEMSLFFPFAGSRGGFLHSGAALQPVWWALTPAGLASFIQWGVRKRNWIPKQATQVFSSGIVLLAVFYTVIIARQMVIGPDPNHLAWNASWVGAVNAEKALNRAGVADNVTVMINNPPGFVAANGGKSIVIPNANLAEILAAGKRYGAQYLILEQNHVVSMENLYEQPRTIGELIYLGSYYGVSIFKIGSG